MGHKISYATCELNLPLYVYIAYLRGNFKSFFKSLRGKYKIIRWIYFILASENLQFKQFIHKFGTFDIYKHNIAVHFNFIQEVK